MSVHSLMARACLVGKSDAVLSPQEGWSDRVVLVVGLRVGYLGLELRVCPMPPSVW